VGVWSVGKREHVYARKKKLEKRQGAHENVGMRMRQGKEERSERVARGLSRAASPPALPCLTLLAELNSMMAVSLFAVP
jgi:hypothetical protein